MRRACSLMIAVAACVLLGAGSQPPRVRPVVHVPSGYLLGGTVNGAWRDGEAVARLLRGRERYRVYGAGGLLGEATGTRPTPNDDVCPETRYVRFTPAREAGRVAVGGAGNALPRPVTRLDPAAPVYRNAVRDILVRNGIRNPTVRINSVTRVDLEGDGRDEVIVSAMRGRLDRGISVDAGDYALFFVRTVIDEQVRTVMLQEEYHPRASNEQINNDYSLAGVLDVDGDGTMEIVMHGRYYEGDWATVFRVRNGRKAELATAGCGV